MLDATPVCVQVETGWRQVSTAGQGGRHGSDVTKAATRTACDSSQSIAAGAVCMQTIADEVESRRRDDSTAAPARSWSGCPKQNFTTGIT